MIAVVDYEGGNLRSVQKALEHVGARVVVTRDMGDPKDFTSPFRLKLQGANFHSDLQVYIRYI